MVRIYVRNKGRYDPKTSESPLPFLDVDNPGDVLIKHVRETVKRQINCKLDELYYNNQLLDEDRSVAYSNLQDGTILESCSNPFWAACMYIRLRSVEQEAANNPTDQKKQRWTHQSILNRAAALGVLFNSNSFERHQPPHLPTLQDLWTCLQTNGRKPVHMSEFTRTALQELQEEFQNIDVHRRDPVASFVHRHAVKLGFRDPNAPGPGDGPDIGDRGNRAPAGQGLVVGNVGGARGNNNRAVGRRRQNRPRPCDDCEAEAASKYCAQCEGGLVLCQPCCDRLHQGRARRHHNIQGVEEAPKAAKSYTPKAYKAPFAMLVALYRGLTQVPQIMSMTADEIKSGAQVFTDTDLSDRAAGKFFGGFDNMQNTLQINGFVQREAGENARFSLLQPGRALAQKCTEFHHAVEDLLNVNRVPKVPPLEGTQCGPRRVCLLVDSKEPLCERMMALAHREGVAAQIRDLPVGDFLWILLPPGAAVDYAAVRPNDEQVLPHIVERKTWDDLQHSLSTRRFRNQVEAMKRCGLRDLFYLVEGHPSDMRARPSKEQIQYFENQLLNLTMKEGFLVNRTGTWLKTAQWLLQLTAMAADMQNKGTNGRLITYAEYSTRASSKNHAAPEARPRPEYLGVHKWSADKLVDMVFRQFHHETNFSDAAKTDLPDIPPTQRTRGGQPLLVIHGLEVYNKNCQKFKDRALAEYLNQQAGERTVREIVDTMLGASVRELIHFDVFCYWQLWLQVHLGCHVRRTETAEETHRLENMYTQNHNGAAPNQQLFWDNLLNHNDDNDDDDDDYGGGARPVGGRGARRGQTTGRGRASRGAVRPQLPPRNRVASGTTAARKKTGPQRRKQDNASAAVAKDPPMPRVDNAGTGNEMMEANAGRRLGSLSTDDFAADSQNEDLMLQQALELSRVESSLTEQQPDLPTEEHQPEAGIGAEESLVSRDDFAADSQGEEFMLQQALELSRADSLPSAENFGVTDNIIDTSRDEEAQLAEALHLSMVEHEKQITAMQEHTSPLVPGKQQDFENNTITDRFDDTEPIEIIDSQEVNETVPETEGSSFKDVTTDEPIEIIDSQDTVESTVEENDCPIVVSDDSQNTEEGDGENTEEGSGEVDLTQSWLDTPEEVLHPIEESSMMDRETHNQKSSCLIEQDIETSSKVNEEDGDSTRKSVLNLSSGVPELRSSEKPSDLAQPNCEGGDLAKIQEKPEHNGNVTVSDHAKTLGQDDQETVPSKSNVECNDRESQHSLRTLNEISGDSHSKKGEKWDDTESDTEVDPDLALAIKLSREEAKLAHTQGHVEPRVTRSKTKSGSTGCNSPTVFNVPDIPNVSKEGKEVGSSLGKETDNAREVLDRDLALALKLSEEEFIASQKQDEQEILQNSRKEKNSDMISSPDHNVFELLDHAGSHKLDDSGQKYPHSSQGRIPCAIQNDKYVPHMRQDVPYSFVENSIQEEEDVTGDFGQVLQLSSHGADNTEDNENKLKEIAATLSGNGNAHKQNENLDNSRDLENQQNGMDESLHLALKLSEQKNSSICSVGSNGSGVLFTKQPSQKNVSKKLEEDYEMAVRVALQEKMDCDVTCSKSEKGLETSIVKREEISEQHDEDLELARKLHEDLNGEALKSEHSNFSKSANVSEGMKSSGTKRKLDLDYERDRELAKQLEAELNGKPADAINSVKRIKVDIDYERDLALARQLESAGQKDFSPTQYEKDLELARKLSEELNSSGSNSRNCNDSRGTPSSKGTSSSSGSSGSSDGPPVFRERRRQRERSTQQLEDYRQLQAQRYRTSAVGTAAAASRSTPLSAQQHLSQHASGPSATDVFTLDNDDDDDLPDIPTGLPVRDASTDNPATSCATGTPPRHITSSTASLSTPSTSARNDTVDGTPSCDGTPGGARRQNTTTCGACGQQGHNRSSRRCPRFFCEEEVNRRQAQAERRQAKAEAEERDFRNSLGRLVQDVEETARVRTQVRRHFEEMDRTLREREEDAQAVIQHLEKGRKKRKK